MFRQKNPHFFYARIRERVSDPILQRGIYLSYYRRLYLRCYVARYTHRVICGVVESIPYM